MKRKIMATLSIVLGIFVILVIGGILIFAFYITPFLPERDSPHHVADFIKKNPDRSSIYFVRNGKVLVDINSDKLFPLASTVKTIIAIEYAKQVGQGKIDAKEPIDLSELDKYYIPGTDGGAHPVWLKDFTEKGLIQNNKVSLASVAKGMIWYSSNANTEFLMEKLGLENINRNFVELGLTQHQKLYPIGSAVLLLRDFSNTELEQMSMDDYIAKSFEIHEKLKNGSVDKTVSATSGIWTILSEKDKIWSDRLPASTTSEYASIMKKINDRNFFDKKTQTALDDVMEVYMQNPKNHEVFERAGGKGGSTAYVLTKSLYATDKNGNKTELCFFFNNLNTFEFDGISDRFQEFEKLMVTDEKFRTEIFEILNKN